MNEIVFSDKGKWNKNNPFLGMAIIGEYPLGGCQLALLLYIIGNYDRGKLTYSTDEIGVSLSYGDIAKKLNTNEWTAKQAARKLISLKLIKQINGRTGRAKYKYIPNVQLIKGIIFKYLEDCFDDKE